MSMITTLTIKCVAGRYLEEPFERVIEVPDDISLGQLHNEIQRLTDFDNDHLFSFFYARNFYNLKTHLVDHDGWGNRRDAFFEFPLHEVYPLPKGMKLFYLFDFGDDWIFQISRSRTSKPPEAGVRYPRLIEKTGPQPQQYPMDDE